MGGVLGFESGKGCKGGLEKRQERAGIGRGDH